MLYREKLERWLQDHVFRPLCKMHGIYKQRPADAYGRIRVKNQKKIPDLPRIVWDKPQLRDEMTKIMLFERLVQSGLLPRKELYRMLNKSPKQIREEFKEQWRHDAEDRKKAQEIAQEFSATPGGMAPGGQGGLPSMGGGGGLMGGMGAPPGGGGPPAGGGLPGATLGPPGLSVQKPLPGAPGGSPDAGITSPMGGGPGRPPQQQRPVGLS